MIFNLEPAELQVVFDSINSQRLILNSVGEKLMQQYQAQQAQNTPPPSPPEPVPSAPEEK